MKICDRIAEQFKDLPAALSVVLKLQSITNRDDAGSHEVAQIFKKDTAIVARVLKLVNSPFYGIRQKISSIEEAVAILGTNAIHQLVLSSAVSRILPPRDSIFNITDFWLHSFGVGTMAKHLCQDHSQDTRNEALMGGLLHDVGRLVFAGADAKRFSAFYYEREAVTDIADETEFFGVDHQRVGEMISEKWNFPKSIRQMIGKHHCPNEADQSYSLVVAAVSAANLLCHIMSVGFSASNYATDFSREAWQMLGLRENDLEAVLVDALKEIDEIAGIFHNI